MTEPTPPPTYSTEIVRTGQTAAFSGTMDRFVTTRAASAGKIEERPQYSRAYTALNIAPKVKSRGQLWPRFDVMTRPGAKSTLDGGTP